MRWLIFGTALIAGSAPAQQASNGDPRIVALATQAGGLMHLPTSSDQTQTVLFPQGERIVSVILSDPSAYFVNVAGAGDSLTVRAANGYALAVMSVRTHTRTYEFELVAGTPGAATVVRLVSRLPGSTSALRPLPQAMARNGATYRYTGNRTLRPVSITDDGNKTYIEWGKDQALPATFGLGPTGDEQMVDGYMREGVFTIDRVYQTLIFRIDKEDAKAIRQEQRRGNG